MQSIFNRNPDPVRGAIISPQWNTARNGLNRNLVKVVSYFHSRSTAVKRNHLLVRMLNSFAVNYEAPLERFYELIDVRSDAVCRSFDLTSSVSDGKSHEGVFYGNGTTEVLVGSSEIFDVHEAATHWRDQAAVKVLFHEKSDLDMHLPDGMAYSQELGIAVVLINIPLLFVMYRGFVLEQLAILRRGGQPKSTSQFVHMYVLPNMIPSHLDLALFNRALAIATNTKAAIGTSRKHPIVLANWTPQTDWVLKDLTAHLMATDMLMHDMLCTLPAVTAVNAAQTMFLPSLTPTYQYRWVELAARAKVVFGCILMSPSKLVNHNRDILQQIARTISYEGPKTQIKKILGDSGNELNEMLDIITQTR